MAYVKQLLDKARSRLVMVLDEAGVLDVSRLLRAGTDIVVVCDTSGAMAGIVTKTDMVEWLAGGQNIHKDARIGSVMRPNVLVCGLDDELHDVWSLMRAEDVKNLPVLDEDNRPVGVLNARDALGILLAETENEEALLRDYVMGQGYR
ncbi:CBS domain-containing protein [Mesorhizobium sp. LHD-90]|uniref:CBS domain-containing protein n=1 Tax=Mesorhizobium sp. LHD-90 TaxID=3071414 RepID=UPI0027E0BDF1|nr:CBS domain-containing protein [Mesorhizobium sp. LHD-90]MDQ6438201.1 CBS domain-containing protein [Mesorhizobium sp. LHD-90]